MFARPHNAAAASRLGPLAPLTTQQWAQQLLAAVIVLTTLLLPDVASAQTVTIQASAVTIEREVERSSGLYPYYLNRLDCIEDDPDRDVRTVMVLQPNITGTGLTSNVDVQVWITDGDTDCENVDNRTTVQKCALVGSKRYTEANPVFSISPRHVMQGIKDRSGEYNYATDYLDDTICDAQQDSSVTFWIILIQDSDVVGTSAKWTETRIDTRPPAAPSSIEAIGGDSLLFLEWEIPTEDEDDDTQGFTFFCEPIGADSGSGSGDANGGAAGAAAIGCSGTPTQLIEGELPPLDLLCGTATGRTVRNGQTDDDVVVNGTQYAVAVASADQLNNAGVLSPVYCATPEEAITFFERYREAGGQGGGGYCGFLSKRSGSGGALLVLLLLVGTGLLRRWRRAA